MSQIAASFARGPAGRLFTASAAVDASSPAGGISLLSYNDQDGGTFGVDQFGPLLEGVAAQIEDVSLSVRESGILDVLYTHGNVLKHFTDRDQLRSVSGTAAAGSVVDSSRTWERVRHVWDRKSGRVVVALMDNTPAWYVMVGAERTADAAFDWQGPTALLSGGVAVAGAALTSGGRAGMWLGKDGAITLSVPQTEFVPMLFLQARSLSVAGVGDWSAMTLSPAPSEPDNFLTLHYPRNCTHLITPDGLLVLVMNVFLNTLSLYVGALSGSTWTLSGPTHPGTPNDTEMSSGMQIGRRRDGALELWTTTSHLASAPALYRCRALKSDATGTWGVGF